MKLLEASNLARATMAEHLDVSWQFAWDNALRRAGRCSYRTKTISLSKPVTEISDEAEVLDTILHEIAHALVGPNHGHDAVWRAQAQALGSSGARVSSAPAPVGRYVATCPNHGSVGSRVRAPQAGRRWWCRDCKSPIVWVDTALVRV